MTNWPGIVPADDHTSDEQVQYIRHGWKEWISDLSDKIKWQLDFNSHELSCLSTFHIRPDSNFSNLKKTHEAAAKLYKR